MNADHQVIADVLISDGLIQAVGADLQACPAIESFRRLHSRHKLYFASPGPCCCLVLLAHLAKSK